MIRSIKNDPDFRKLPEDARQYEGVPNSPWSFRAEVSEYTGMSRSGRLISVIEFKSAPPRR